MATFSSDTQYSPKFLNGEREISACSYFALTTAHEFVNGDSTETTTKEMHVANLERAVELYHKLNTAVQFGNYGGQMGFEDLLQHTNKQESAVQATSSELIRENIVGYSNIFPVGEDSPNKYAVILLKNSRFVAFLVDQEKSLYCVRDCHHAMQCNYNTRDEMIAFCKGEYKFEDKVMMAGYTVNEYSNLEFLVIPASESSFEVKFNDKTPSPPPTTSIMSDELNDQIDMLVSMGFVKEVAQTTLQQTEGNIELAVELLTN
jgi:hypothetical protein